MRAAVCGLSHRSRGSARQRARWPRPAQGRASRGRERYRLHRPRLLATILPSHPRAIRFPPLMNPEIVAGLLFLATYALIVTEKIHRTLAALLGASLMILFRIVDQNEAFAFVDLNVILLLAGMMIIANITAKTGAFQWIAVEAVRRAEGRAGALVLYLVCARWLFRREVRDAVSALEPEDIRRLVEEERRIAGPRLMRISAVVIGLTIVGFLLSRPLGLQGATIALTGAVVLMIVAREDVHEILKTVEWPTLFFFLGLFIVVGGVVKTR